MIRLPPAIFRPAMPKRFVLAVLLASALAAGVAWARGPTPHGGNQMSLAQAVQQVQRQTQGRILAADMIPRGDAKLYRIKVLTPDGRVRVMQLHSDAKPEPAPDNKAEAKEKH